MQAGKTEDFILLGGLENLAFSKTHFLPTLPCQITIFLENVLRTYTLSRAVMQAARATNFSRGGPEVTFFVFIFL